MVHRAHKVNLAHKVRLEKMVRTELKDSRARKVNPVLKGLQVKMEPKAPKAQLVKTEFRAHKAPKARKVRRVRKERLDRLALMAMMASRPMPMPRMEGSQEQKKNLRKSWQPSTPRLLN